MKYVLGSKYTIQFWDHCIGAETRILCEVTIWITKEDATHIYGTWWRVLNDPDAEVANREPVSIIKSTIVKKRKLK